MAALRLSICAASLSISMISIGRQLQSQQIHRLRNECMHACYRTVHAKVQICNESGGVFEERSHSTVCACDGVGLQVCIIPGSSCGAPGHIRAAFANLPPAATEAAAAALKAGLQQLARDGPAALQAPAAPAAVS